jgi:hypothetical protein
MIKFNPENKDVLTIGEIFDPILKIRTKKVAKQYIADYASFCEKQFGHSRTHALELIKNNICFYAGYYTLKIQKKIEKLFVPIIDSLMEEQFHRNKIKRGK